MFGVKSSGGNCFGGNFMGYFLWGNCPGRKLCRGNYTEGKSWKGNFLGAILKGKLSGG